jgi:16S rRNA (cytidine1402-2'-O)-methyltransferase
VVGFAVVVVVVVVVVGFAVVVVVVVVVVGFAVVVVVVVVVVVGFAVVVVVVAVLSEAGCPAIADPGADVVAIAQRSNFKVVPLIGPSSILLALMGSGFNGQSFAFVGYLPIQPEERAKALKKLESRAYTESQSQLFIETPYRNMKMLEQILKTCQPNTRLCIAADITLETEYIKTKTVKEWKSQSIDLSKRPCIFILYK